MSTTKKKAIDALQRQFSGRTGDAGYVSRPEENLVKGVQLRQFESDLQKGAGNELHSKFLAVHSSTALAVNSFAPFKDAPESLACCGRTGFSAISFERECRTGLRGGTHPHLDVWLENDREICAVESKLTEYFNRKVAEYSDSYQREKFPHAEDCWWDLLENSKFVGMKHLDVAQLVKHYLGLIRYLKSSESTAVRLLYLYWEPTNGDNIDACIQHRRELRAFSERVIPSEIQFVSQTYSDLWREWQDYDGLKGHAGNLIARYGVQV
ncbi:MAG: hypothetical protein ABGZ35_16105 [Planctomycetaceae bacterium]